VYLKLRTTGVVALSVHGFNVNQRKLRTIYRQSNLSTRANHGE